jgi:hypothetical protein
VRIDAGVRIDVDDKGKGLIFPFSPEQTAH